MSYLGIPPFGRTARTITEIVATSGQTVFYPTGGYVPGYIDIALNGALLNSSDYTANNSTTVELTTACASGDEVRITSYTLALTQLDTSTLAAVATTGSYTDLLNTPILFSGSYNDLTNKPTISGLQLSDVGTAANQIPINQYLGGYAYMNPDQFVAKLVASTSPGEVGDMVFQLTNNTTLVVKVRGSDGTVRSVTLTLA